MRVNLIYFLYELNGAYTSFEDLFYNLKKFTDNDVRFIILYEDKDVLLRFKEYLATGAGICYLQIEKEGYHNMKFPFRYDIKGDINVISTEIIQLEWHGRFTQHADKTYLLYPAFIYKDEGKDHSIFEYQMNYIKKHNVLTICNEFNAKYVKDSFIWYMKFSKERIEKIKKLVSSENGTLVAEDYYKNKMEGKNTKPFSYKKYEYYRYDKKNDFNNYTDDGARYYENIGKLMFEFVFLGKESTYSPKNKKFFDGLSEFMRYVGYDDEQEYVFNQKDLALLEEKLYMNEDDEILKLFSKEG